MSRYQERGFSSARTISLGITIVTICVIVGALSILQVARDTSNQLPIASFTYSPTVPTVADAVQFTDTSTDPDGTITSWSWSFGDESVSTMQNPMYQYTTAGTYTVTLTVTDNGGATDSVSLPITVGGQRPEASFTYSPSSPVQNENVNFDGSGSSDSDGYIVGYSWNFDDWNTDSGATVPHAYSLPGSYSVTLTVTDNSGLTDSCSQTVTVSSDGGASFAPPLRIAGTQILDANGTLVRLKGVTTEQAWNLSESNIRYLKNRWKVNVIRLPIRPNDCWFVDPSAREFYLSIVDQFMSWAWNSQIYVILDGWQQYGNPASIQSYLQSAWHTLANRYENWPHVIWNSYNEPDDTISWNQWVPIAENLIDIILSYDPVSKVFTVDGVRWSKVFDVRTRPINRDNVIYAPHVYPDTYGGSDSWNADTWDSNYGYIALEGYGPVLVEEWAFPHHDQGDRPNFGEPLLNYCNDRGFSWIGWIWSDTWTPYMFLSGDPEDRTEFGQLTWEALTGVWGPS